MQTGECFNALHRDDIGDISIVWGEVTDPIKHKGYGLSHIIDKHEEGIKKLGFRIKGREKQWVLTAFDLRKKPRK